MSKNDFSIGITMGIKLSIVSVVIFVLAQTGDVLGSMFRVQDSQSKSTQSSRDDGQPDISKLIEDLNSPSFETREAAEQRLLGLGDEAIEALIKAKSGDVPSQTLFRANRILMTLGDRSLGYINLAGTANHRLDQRFGRFAGNHLDSLPRGEQEFGSFKFKIDDDVLLLGSRDLPDRPRSVEGIKVESRIEDLNILHAMLFGSNVAEGNEIAKYVVHYEDGSSIDIVVTFGVDVRDWWNYDDSQPVTKGQVVWRGNNAVADSSGHALRLYASTWTNPTPDKRVEHIDFVATHDIAAPFCIAMTIARSDSDE